MITNSSQNYIINVCSFHSPPSPFTPKKHFTYKMRGSEEQENRRSVTDKIYLVFKVCKKHQIFVDNLTAKIWCFLNCKLPPPPPIYSKVKRNYWNKIFAKIATEFGRFTLHPKMTKSIISFFTSPLHYFRTTQKVNSKIIHKYKTKSETITKTLYNWILKRFGSLDFFLNYRN